MNFSSLASRRLRNLVPLFVILAAPPLFSQTSEVYALATNPNYNPPSSAPNGSVTASYVTPYQYGPGLWSYDNHASASPGFLSVDAFHKLEAGVYQYVLPSPTVRARWRDQITINAPGLTGTQGLATLTYRVDGSIDLNATNEMFSYDHFAKGGFSLWFGAEQGSGYYEEGVPAQIFGNTSWMNKDLTLTKSFVFGQPFEVTFEIYGRTAIDGRWAPPGSTSQVKLKGVWKGITVTQSGSPVSSVTTSSLMGANYGNEIEDPTPTVPFAEWVMNLPEGKRGPDDRNGPLQIPNLCAFGLGLDPLTATSDDLPKFLSVAEDGTKTFRFSKRRKLVGVELNLLASAIISNLTALDPAITPIKVSTSGDTEIWEVHFPASTPRMFVQTKAVLTAP